MIGLKKYKRVTSPAPALKQKGGNLASRDSDIKYKSLVQLGVFVFKGRVLHLL